MLGEGRARLPFLPPFLPPRHPPLPPRVPDDDARARNNAKGRSKGPSKEHRGCSAHFPITRDVPGGGHCVPPPLARTHGAVPAPRSPQLPEGDVLVEAQAVVPLLLRHVAPLLPARKEPLWHHRPPRAPCIPLSMSPRARGHLRARWLPERAPCWMGSGAHTSTRPVVLGQKKGYPGDEVLFS